MQILPPIKEQLRRAIRDARAADPLITVSVLQAVLEKRFGRGISRAYIGQLADKVHRETLIEANRMRLDERLNVTREKFRLVSERLMEILNWELAPPNEGENFVEWLKRVRPPKTEEVIEAAKTLAMLDLALLRAEVEYGQFKDPTAASGDPAKCSTLPAEQRDSIVVTFCKWGMLRSGTVAKLTERPLTLYAGKPKGLPQLDAETFAHAIGDPTLRKVLVRAHGFGVWCLIYLSHYFELEPANFFPELIGNLDDDALDALLIIGFRGSAKSTFVNRGLPGVQLGKQGGMEGERRREVGAVVHRRGPARLPVLRRDGGEGADPDRPQLCLRRRGENGHGRRRDDRQLRGHRGSALPPDRRYYLRPEEISIE